MAEKTFLDKLKDIIRKNAGKEKTKNAINWFQRKVGALKGELVNQFSDIDNADDFYKKSKKSKPNTLAPGEMASYFYNPKYKEILPYYDRFPLILCVQMYPNGFLGLNFHYLPPLLRAKLMDEIDKSKTLNWKALSRIKEVRPTIKRYLFKHITSKIVIIEEEEKNIVLFLPTERFKKETKKTVWKESKGMIR